MDVTLAYCLKLMKKQCHESDYQITIVPAKANIINLIYQSKTFEAGDHTGYRHIGSAHYVELEVLIRADAERSIVRYQ